MTTTIHIIGNIVKDPVKNEKTGTVSFSVAVNRREGGPLYYSCMAVGRNGECCMQYLHKGDRVSVYGVFDIAKKENKTFLNIYVYGVDFLNSPKGKAE